MNDNEVKTVQMTAEEAAQYAAFKAEQERKAAADKARKDRKVYGQMVDEEIEQGKYPLIPTLWMIFEDSTFAFRSGDKHRSRRIYGK